MKRTLKTLSVLTILLFILTQCVEEPTAPPLTAVGGVVKDANGALVDGATVTISDKNTVTDAKGAYYFDDISSGSYTIKISKNNYADGGKNIAIKTGVVSLEELTILRLGGIVGKVTNAEGNGEEGVKITTLPQSKETITDAEGNYSLLDLTAGSYVIKAEKEKYATITKEVTVADGEVSSGNFILYPPFFCGSPITYSGKTFNTVQIGDQCWFKENLNVGTRIDGVNNQTNNSGGSIIEKYCYNNEEANCDTYGGLYQWNEAMQYVTTEGTQGICPEGWHIPTYAEMQSLQANVNNDANKLIDANAKSGYTYSNGTGFSALFAGGRYYGSGSFYGLGDYTYFWSSIENGSGAVYMGLNYDGSYVGFDNSDKSYGFSVRCLKD